MCAVPTGLDTIFSVFPRTSVLGYHLPPLRGWNAGGSIGIAFLLRSFRRRRAELSSEGGDSPQKLSISPKSLTPRGPSHPLQCVISAVTSLRVTFDCSAAIVGMI
jgi:hypothetical protein